MSNIAAIQMNSTADLHENLLQAKKLIAEAAQKGAQLAVLPENFALMGKHEEDKLKIKENFGGGVIQDFLAAQAIQNKIWIVGGTIPINSTNPDKVYATCLIYNTHGECVARYDKIHLFDVNVSSKNEIYEESRSITPGDKIIVIPTPMGKLGVAICYDIRFPELLRAMHAQHVEIIALPTAFTKTTGQAHWEILTRARAIENLCYFVGACQTGIHANGRQTYGHSVIIDPWGKVLAELTDGVGVITSAIDLKQLHELRQRFPALQHKK